MNHYDMIDAAPLLRAVENAAVPLAPGPRRAWSRGRSRGTIERYSADRFAVKVLHVHPCAIWPDWFEGAS